MSDRGGGAVMETLANLQERMTSIENHLELIRKRYPWEVRKDSENALLEVLKNVKAKAERLLVC